MSKKIPSAAVLSDEEVVEYLEDLTERADPADGFPVLHAARRFATFRRMELPLDWFSPAVAQEPVSPSCVALYASEAPTTAPPVVVDGVDRIILDGYHRFHAAVRRGDATIAAYVGEQPRQDWLSWDDLAEDQRQDPSSQRWLPVVEPTPRRLGPKY